jgi:hypothetical protein
VIKFIQRARSGNTESVADALKLLQIGKGKGHFATTNKTREEDCWLLIKKIGDTYNKMVPMMRNRKNKTNRKNRNRMNRSRKNRNENGTLVPMMGGRRRRGRGRVTRRH